MDNVDVTTLSLVFIVLLFFLILILLLLHLLRGFYFLYSFLFFSSVFQVALLPTATNTTTYHKW